MTTLHPGKVSCFVCGARSSHHCIMSTNAMGRPDLDGRPPEMMRSTMFAWVQRCPQCGYCAPNLSTGGPEARACVRRAEYQNTLQDAQLPRLAASFLCDGIVSEARGDFAASGHARLRAAWACDDAKERDLADNCRRSALRMFEAAQHNRQVFMRGSAGHQTLMADLLRRTRQFAKALTLSAPMSPAAHGDLSWVAYRFELLLSARGEDGCYTLQHAMEYARDAGWE